MFRIFFTSLVGLILSTSTLFAQEMGGCNADTLGGMFCVVQESSIAQLIALLFGAAFIGGLVLTYQGIVQMVAVTDTQKGQGGTISGALLTLASGAFLVALPSTILVGLGTAGISDAWDFRAQDTVGDASGSLGSEDFLSMIGNFAINAAGPLSTLVMGIAVLVGVFLVANSMFGLARLNSPQSRGEGFGPIATKFVVGIALINIFWVMELVGASFGLSTNGGAHFTDITSKAMSYSTQAAADGITVDQRFQSVMQIAFLALIPFGLIAFVRGLLIIKDAASSSQRASLGMGFTHLVGGVALVNAQDVSCAVMKTLTGGAGFCIG